MDSDYLKNLNYYERIHVLKKMEYNMDNYSKNDVKIEIFKILNNCKCCNDHQINKPSVSNLYNFDGNYSSPTQNNKKCCICPCKHICRTICRELFIKTNIK